MQKYFISETQIISELNKHTLASEKRDAADRICHLPRNHNYVHATIKALHHSPVDYKCSLYQ